MKKLFILALALLAGCSSGSGETQFSLEEDEENRQAMYSYFNGIFYNEADTSNFPGVVGGNVLGVEKLDTNFYRADVVMFNGNEPTQYGFDVSAVGGEVKSAEVTGSRELVLGKSEEMYAVASDSGAHKTVLQKSLVAVEFYTVGNDIIPGFLGLYELVVDGAVVDISFDRFSTNLPFEFKGYSDNERYLEFFEQDLGRSFNIYDIEKKQLTDIELAGVYSESFWIDGNFLVCTTGEFMPVASIFEDDKWGFLDQRFIVPEELNSMTEDEIWDYVASGRNQKLDCEAIKKAAI